MAVAWHSVVVAQLEPSGSVLVVGGVPIGPDVCYATRARCVETIVVSEPSESRRELLRAVGINHVVDPTSERALERIWFLTRDRGVDAVIDAAGSEIVFREAMRRLAAKGLMVVVAVYERPYEFTPEFLSGGRSIRHSELHTHDDYRDVIETMAGGVYDSVIRWTEIVELERVEEALRELRAGHAIQALFRRSRQI